MRTGDFVRMSKLAKLKVLLKVKAVQEMYLGIEAWVPGVPRPDDNMCVDESCPIEAPVMPGKNPQFLLSWRAKTNIHRISPTNADVSSGLTISTILVLNFDEDSDTYNVEEVTGELHHNFADAEHTAGEDIAEPDQ